MFNGGNRRSAVSAVSTCTYDVTPTQKDVTPTQFAYVIIVRSHCNSHSKLTAAVLPAPRLALFGERRLEISWCGRITEGVENVGATVFGDLGARYGPI